MDYENILIVNSMYAAHAIKARNFPPNCETFVCGCEMATEMFDIAKEVIAVNGFSGEITLLNKMSTDITIPHDIPARLNFEFLFAFKYTLQSHFTWSFGFLKNGSH